MTCVSVIRDWRGSALVVWARSSGTGCPPLNLFRASEMVTRQPTRRDLASTPARRDNRTTRPREEPMDLELRGRTAVVTGCSVGIGREIARVLAAEGVAVLVVARRGDLLKT